MKLQRIYTLVTAEPWLITAPAHQTIQKLVEAHMEGKTAALNVEYEKPEITMQEGGIAVVPVAGVIGKGLSAIEKSCGACGIEDVEDDLAECLMNELCSGVVLHIDSPGGAVTGVPELASKISELAKVKSVVAFTDGQCDSAAYWLAAGCKGIVASASAEVGSIGVYMPWADQTKRFEQAGVKMDVIKNTGGTFKGMGIPGTSLTEEQRAHLQQRVDQIYGMFTGHVTAYRDVKPETMRGQTFLAAEAKEAGLIDQIGDIGAAVQMARQLTRKE